MPVVPVSGNGREQGEDAGRKAVRYGRSLGAPPVSFREMVLVGLLGKDGNGQDQGDQAENCREGREGALSWFHTVFLVHEGEQTKLGPQLYQSGNSVKICRILLSWYRFCSVPE